MAFWCLLTIHAIFTYATVLFFFSSVLFVLISLLSDQIFRYLAERGDQQQLACVESIDVAHGVVKANKPANQKKVRESVCECCHCQLWAWP